MLKWSLLIPKISIFMTILYYPVSQGDFKVRIQNGVQNVKTSKILINKGQASGVQLEGNRAKLQKHHDVSTNQD